MASNPGPEWRARLVAPLLGLAVGMGTNVLSNDAGYRWTAAVFALAGVAAGANWVRGLPPRAPLRRWSARTTLVAALLAGLAALAVPAASGYLVVAAAVLVAGAILTSTDLSNAGHLLGGAALIGLGVSLAGYGWQSLVAGGQRPLATIVGGGIAAVGMVLVGSGGAMIGGRSRMVSVGFIGLGTGMAGGGVLLLVDHQWIGGVAVLGLGIAGLELGVATLAARDRLVGAGLIGAGIVSVGVAVALLITQNWLAGAALIGAALPVIGMGLGTASLLDRARLAGAGLAVIGGEGVAAGTAILVVYRSWLFGAAMLGLGLAAGLLGIGALSSAGTFHQIRARVTDLSRDPHN